HRLSRPSPIAERIAEPSCPVSDCRRRRADLRCEIGRRQLGANMRHLITTLVLIVLAWPPAATAAGPETMGPLAPHIDLDPQGTPWRVVEEQGRLVVENSSEAGRVTYYFVEPQERPVAVSVSV